jgi:hypothetical protein
LTVVAQYGDALAGGREQIQQHTLGSEPYLALPVVGRLLGQPRDPCGSTHPAVHEGGVEWAVEQQKPSRRGTVNIRSMCYGSCLRDVAAARRWLEVRSTLLSMEAGFSSRTASISVTSATV